MKTLAISAAALLLPVCLGAAEYNDTSERTFQVSGPDARLIVDNINGNITVTGDSGNTVRVKVREHWKANTQEDLDRGRSDIRLEMQQTGNTVRLFLDGPFRDRGRRVDRGRHLEFRHDFEVQVPREIALELKTINGGQVRAEGTRGEFHLKNINGGITLVNSAGSGEAETINGSVVASFEENPAKPSRFKSINGALDVSFQPSLAADLSLKSFNGDGYTDFDSETASGEMRAGRKIRIGGGGVEHSFETLNGNIKITKYGRK